MLAQGVTRSHSVRVHAFEGAAAGRQLRPGSSSRAHRRRRSSSLQKLQEFISLWAPLLETEHAKIKRAADRLSSIEQVLAATEPDPMQVNMRAAGEPGLKLTAARTYARWPAALVSSSSDADCWSLQHSSITSQLAEAPDNNSTISGAAAGGLQTELLQLRATEAEVAALLDSCMQGMDAVVVASGPRAARSALLHSKHSSNIVPWAQPAAPEAPAAPAAAAAAAAPTVDAACVSEAAVTDTPTSAAAPPPQPPPTSAAAAPTALEAVADTPTEQLVMVYCSAASPDPAAAAAAAAAAASQPAPPAVVGGVVPPNVRYLRLPQQQAEYESALQAGLRVVPVTALTGCGSSSSSSSSVSCEELAWMSQVAGCWGPTEQEPAEFFSLTAGDEATAPAAAAADEGGEGVDSAAPVVAPPAPAEPRTVKVEVGVHMPTKPGQRVLLVGSHPVLGSWDVSQAFKAKWSEGHIWRACLELPSNIRSIEFKAVLKSADKAVWERGSNKQVQLEGSETVAMQYAFKA